MTYKERIAILAIFVSTLGFSFVFALKPLTISHEDDDSKKQRVVIDISKKDIDMTKVYYSSSEVSSSKMANMLSEVLEIEKDDILLALEGGIKPKELLLSSGILLSELPEAYLFDIIGDDLVRFRV